MDRAVRAHLLGFAIVSFVALVLHYLVLPSIGVRIAGGLRGEPFYWLALLAALVPVALWVVPQFSAVLGRGAFEFHRRFFQKGGAYVRLPNPRKVRFPETLLLAIGPFAIDLFVIAEVLYLVGPRATASRAGFGGFAGFSAFLLVLLLAGLLTSLLPGPWLLDALELRLIAPDRGEVVRPAEVFARTIGPSGAAFLLASYVTLLHTSQNLEYDRALFELGLWAVRLFPAVLGAVCVYRLKVEPRVLPGLRAWCAKQGIATASSLPQALEALLRPSPVTLGARRADDPEILVPEDPNR